MNNSQNNGCLSIIKYVFLFVLVVFLLGRCNDFVHTGSFKPSPTSAPAATPAPTAAPTSTPSPTATPEPTASPDQADADRVGYPLDQYLNMKQTMLDCGFDETTIRLVKAIGTNEAYCNWASPLSKSVSIPIIRSAASMPVIRIFTTTVPLSAT